MKAVGIKQYTGPGWDFPVLLSSLVICHLGANRSLLFKFHQILEVPRKILSNFIKIQTLEAFLIFNLKFILNLEKFQ
jgi:hypothetical protein